MDRLLAKSANWGVEAVVVSAVYDECGCDVGRAEQALRKMLGVNDEEALFEQLSEEFNELDAALIFAVVQNCPDEEQARAMLCDLVVDMPQENFRDSSRGGGKKARQEPKRKMTWQELRAEYMSSSDVWLKQDAPLADKLKSKILQEMYPYASLGEVASILKDVGGSSSLAEEKLIAFYPVDTPGASAGFSTPQGTHSSADYGHHQGQVANEHREQDQAERSLPDEFTATEFPPRPPGQRGRPPRLPEGTVYRFPSDIQNWLSAAFDLRIQADNQRKVGRASGQHELYSRRASESDEQADGLILRAAKAMGADTRFRSASSVDLHGFRVKDALVITEAKIRATLMHTTAEAVEFITGRGHNSGPGGPKLLPALQSYARVHGFRAKVDPYHEGAVVINLCHM